MSNQAPTKLRGPVSLLLCLLCILTATSCGTSPTGGEGTVIPVATTLPPPDPTPTIDMGHARQAFESGGELTYPEVVALRLEIVGDPKEWQNIKNINMYNKAQEEYNNRELAFGQKLEKCKLKETIGWVAWPLQEYDSNYQVIPDKNRQSVYLANPFDGPGKDIQAGFEDNPEMYLVYFTDNEIAQFKLGSRIQFSGDLLLVDHREAVTNVKYKLLEDDPPVAAPTADELKDFQITLSRGGCYGTCPGYTLTIKADGTLTFEGGSYTETKGVVTGKLDDAKLLELATEVKRADFFSLDNNYEAAVTDLPTYVLRVQMGGQTKQVRSYGTGPRRLEILMDRIDQIADTHQWIGSTNQP